MTCDHCEELAEKIRQLERELYGRDWEPPLELRLTPLESAMLAALVRSGRTCTVDFLINATRGIRTTHKSYPQSNIIDSKICHIRQKLKPFGLEVKTVWGRGFQIEEASRDRLLNWNQARAA